VFKHRLILLIVLAALVSGCAAGRAFRRGQEAARLGDWDAAVTHYTTALQEDPDNAHYKIELERAMQNAAREYITRAREAEARGDIDTAMLAYRRAVEMDASNRLAAAKVIELERAIRDRIEKSRPKPEIEKLRERARLQTPVLVPPTVSLPKVHFNNASLRDVLNHIAALSGINVTFDTQLFRDQPVTVSLENVTVEEALRQILSQSGHFYKVMNPTTIVVAQDTAQARQKYEELVVQTFYLSHADAQEVSQIINTVMRIPNMTVVPALFPNKTANSITVRATAAVVQVIEQLIRSNDKPRAEVVVDVQILEVNRQRVKQYGLDLSSYAVNLIFSPEVAPPNTPGPVNTAPPPFNLNTISQGVSTADFYLGVPTAIFRFLETDSNTRLLAKPQLRGAEGRPMTLNLGQEIPVVSTVFGAPVSGGFASIPQSSFNYRPVGINMEILPRVTYDGEIILELTVENSALGPSIDVAGQSVPSFTSRKVQTKLRLREGESNLLAGLVREEDRKDARDYRADPGADHQPDLRLQRQLERTDRHRHAADAAHRADARADGRRSRARLHRHAAEHRAWRAAAVDRAAAGRSRRGCCRHRCGRHGYAAEAAGDHRCASWRSARTACCRRARRDNDQPADAAAGNDDRADADRRRDRASVLPAGGAGPPAGNSSAGDGNAAGNSRHAACHGHTARGHAAARSDAAGHTAGRRARRRTVVTDGDAGDRHDNVV
jgi:general secretion pathway protein D